MPEIIADLRPHSCYHLFPDLESRNFKGLLLISLLLARAREASQSGPVGHLRGCATQPKFGSCYQHREQNRLRTLSEDHSADRD